MKNTDQATRRLWRVSWSRGGHYCIYASNDMIARFSEGIDESLEHIPNMEANAALIVQAVNEYEALCAVADAAQWLNIAIAENKLWGQAEEAVNEARIKLGDALASLAAVRNGGAK